MQPCCRHRAPQVELREDLVAGCVVGDVITVLGLVKVLATGDAKPAGTTRRLARACHGLCLQHEGRICQVLQLL